MSMEILQEQDKELQIIYNSASFLELDLSIAKSIRQVLIYWAIRKVVFQNNTPVQTNRKQFCRSHDYQK